MTAATQQVAKRVVRNTVAQVAAMASTVVSKLLITILLGRLFGAERVGDYAAVMTFGLLFTFLASLGLHWTLIRETAVHAEDVHQYAGNGFSLVFMAGLLTIPLMVGAAAGLGYGRELLAAVALMGLALLFDCLAQLVGAVFNGLERMELGAAIIIVQEVTFLLAGVLVLWLRLPFLWLFVVYVPSRFVGLLLAFGLYRRLFGRGLRPEFDIPFIRSLLRTTAPFAANMALGPIYLRVDVLLLSFYKGSLAVGLYEATAAIFYRFNILARMFNNALMPVMAREYETEAARIRSYVNAAARYQTLIGLPLTLFCMLLGERIVVLIYGPDFAESGLVFSLMASIILLRFLDNTLATTLTAVNMQTQRSIIVGLTAVFNIALNVYVLPLYSFQGAAVTTILTELVFFAGLYLVLARRVPQPLQWSGLVRPFLAAMAMGLAVWLLGDRPLLLHLIVSGAVYVGVLLALGGITREEWRFLWNLLYLDRLVSLQLNKVAAGDAKSIPGGK
jgi:O-antigen/teichoic acid export membrane protein